MSVITCFIKHVFNWLCTQLRDIEFIVLRVIYLVKMWINPNLPSCLQIFIHI